MSRGMNDALLRACRDDNLFGHWFHDPATWRAWFVFIRALFGLPPEGEDLELVILPFGSRPGRPALRPFR